MRRIFHLGWVALIICLFLAGCSEDNEEAATKPKNEQKTVVDKKEEPPENSSDQIVEKGTPEWDFQQIIKSVNDNDEAVFMSYQNKDNPIFYKEQKRWIEEAVFKKGQGSSLTVDFENFEKESDTTGTVTLKVDMTAPGNGSSTNYIKYQTIKVNDKWLLNDVPFEEMKSETENITVYYNKGEEEAAKKTLKDATDIVSFYKRKFNWNPGPLSIKLYPTPGEVSATVPWVSLAGWNEVGESIKITTELTQRIFSFLAHELTHKMLGDVTNDNASIYIQEGFASFGSIRLSG
ncbi:hypothetical protein [Falsibacillus pallidus]|uniref:hypothetical protein n=1 Tax=Falsibacillus pallidus TaxID=493781 RepID=UPI003D95D517